MPQKFLSDNDRNKYLSGLNKDLKELENFMLKLSEYSKKQEENLKLFEEQGTPEEINHQKRRMEEHERRKSSISKSIDLKKKIINALKQNKDEEAMRMMKQSLSTPSPQNTPSLPQSNQNSSSQSTNNQTNNTSSTNNNDNSEGNDNSDDQSNPPSTSNESSGDSGGAKWYQVKWTGLGDWGAESSHTLFFFYVIVLLAHVVDSFVLEYRGNIFRAILYLVVFIISWFLVFGRGIQPISRQGGQRLLFAFILALIAFLVPVIEWQLLKNIMDEKLIHILQMWLGFYPSYLIATAKTKGLMRLQKWWTGMWIILGVLFLVVAIMNGGLRSLPIPESTEDFDPWESFMAVLNFIWETITNGIAAFGKVITGKINQTGAFGTGRIDYATGGYYSGQEESVEEQGVFIRNIELSQPEYKVNDTIEIFYNIEMKTPAEGYIEANIVCLVEGESEEDVDIIGDVGNEQNLKLYNYEIMPLSCIFMEGFDKGSHKVILRVSYTYGTTSRIESHFIDLERKNAYRAEGIDILKEYGKDSTPTSTYTQGPMNLGLEIGTQPIGIISGSSGPRIGFTLEGDWSGKIKEIKNINISLPEGLILDTNQIGDCAKFSESSQGENKNVYIYSEPEIIGEIEDYRSFNCKTIISNFDKLMGKNEISTKYIKVETSYEYEYEETKSIRVV